MFTRRPMTHQQQQPRRDHIAQLQQQSGSSEFQRRAHAPTASAAAQLGDVRSTGRERSGQH